MVVVGRPADGLQSIHSRISRSSKQASRQRQRFCAVLYVADIAKDIGSGIRMAREAIESGAARNKLNDFITATQASL